MSPYFIPLDFRATERAVGGTKTQAYKQIDSFPLGISQSQSFFYALPMETYSSTLIYISILLVAICSCVNWIYNIESKPE